MDRYGRADEPVAVLQAAIHELTQGRQQIVLEPVVKQPEVPSFIPAATFRGARKGYYFGTGDEGSGYYRDEQQSLEPEDVAAVVKQRQDPQELLREAEEQAEAAEVQLLDEKSLRKMLNALEKKAKENLELRMKYADDPMKFLDNEVDLMGLIRGLAQIAAEPNTLYPMLIDSPVVATLASLLSHDNTDIAMEVMDLLQEITDADEEEDNEEVAGQLIDALVEANGLELLVERLGKLNESVDEEAQAVNHALAVIEHAVELRPVLADSLCDRTKLMKWLLSRIRVKASDSNKQYASEILSILVQGHEANQKLLGAANGIDHLLVCLAGFKNKDPGDAEEQEFVENLFDTLCSCLLSPTNRASFVECEGVELMHLLLKGKKSSRYGAIKTLDFATTRSPSACDRLVDAGALAQLFAIFMGRSKIKNSRGTRSDKEVAKEVEERCVSIISNLFQGVTKDSRKHRLAAKFVESEFEKVDRLMEVCFRYESNVRACEARLARQALDEDEVIDDEELLLERMDAGLFTLQCGMVVVAALWSTGDVGLRKRLLAHLHQKGQSLEMVRSYLEEFYFGVGDDGAPDEKQRQLQRLGQLLAALGVDIAAQAAAREAANGAAADVQQQGQQQHKGTIIYDQDGDADMDLEQPPNSNPPVPPDEQELPGPPLPLQAANSYEQDVVQSPHRNGLADSELLGDHQQQQQETAQERRPSTSDRDRDKKRGRDRDRDREKGTIQRDEAQREGRQEDRREKDGEQPRERDKQKEREREKDRERDRDRDRGKGRDRDREREREHRHSRSHSRGRSPDNHRRRHRSRERDEGLRSGSSRHKRSRRSRSRSRSR